MAKIGRVLQNIFGETHGTNEFTQIGSVAEGAPVYTTDPVAMQALARFKGGLFDICIGENSPIIEDINSLFYLMTRQIAYILQNGIPEWETNTVYFIGSFASDGSGNIYKSIIDDNENPLTDGSSWTEVAGANDDLKVLQNMAVREWTTRTHSTANAWTAICYSENLGLFAAVSTSGTATRVMTSPDGITWTTRTSSTDSTWTAICWSPDLSLFVAVNRDGATRAMTSPDGITWTARSVGANDKEISGVCWSPALGLFVATVGTAGTTSVYTSPNGTTWTNRTTPNGAFFDVVWCAEKSLFIAVGTDSGLDDPYIISSPDGTTWTARYSLTVTDGILNSVVWCPGLGADGLFIATGQSAAFGPRTFSSPDGITWSQITPTGMGSAYFKKTAWSESLKLLVSTASAVGMYSSKDGVAWTKRSTADNEFLGVCWSDQLSIFVAVGSTAGSGAGTARVITSR